MRRFFTALLVASLIGTVIPIPAQASCLPGALFDIQTGQPCSKTTTTSITTAAVNPACTPIVFTKTLSLGMRSVDVTKLQQFLRTQGDFIYPTNPGVYGSVTAAAVRKFQVRNKISTTGTVGPLTRAKIQQLSCNGSATTTTQTVAFNRNLTVGSTGSDVKALQVFLNKSATTKISISGAGSPGFETTYFGLATQSALKKYQSINKLTVTGILDLPTRTFINKIILTSTGGENNNGNGGVVVISGGGGGSYGGGGSSSGGGGNNPSPTTYTINASAGSGGSVNPGGTISVNQGSSQTITFTPATGYQIQSVLVDGVSIGAANSYTFTNVVSNHTISVSFIQIPVTPTTYTITATAGVGGTISPSGVSTVTSGTDKTYTITPNSGYQIASVVVNGSSVGSPATYTFNNITGNQTIAATFSQIPALTYTVRSSSGANGTISPLGTNNITQGTPATYTITADSGYQVASVTVDGVNKGAITSYTFPDTTTGSHTISATFAAVQQKYTITATTGTGGSVGPSGTISVNEGTSQTFTITSATGYRINQVLVDGVNQGAITTYTFPGSTSGSHTISATFTLVTYTITASASANGTISPNGTITVNSGSTQNYTVTPNSGYQISQVLVDGTSQSIASTYSFTNITANHTIAASFSQVPQDPTGGTALYVAPTGSDAANCTQASPCRQISRALNLSNPGTTIFVADGSYSGFTVDTENGTAGSPITIKAQGTGANISSTSSQNGDSIFVTDSSYITIDGLNAANAVRNGVRISNSSNIILRNGVFANNQHQGIFTDFSTNILIENNTAYGTKDQHGIYVSNSSAANDAVTVRGNTVYGNTQNGIQFNGDCTAGGDGTLSNNVIENNTVHDNGWKGLSLIAFANSIVRNNLIYNNRTLGSGAAGVHLADEPGCNNPSSNNSIVNNTIVEPRMAAVRITTGASNVIFNNIAVGTSGIVDESGSTNTIDVSSNLSRTSSTGIFTNVASNIYTLSASSPAIDIGKASLGGKVAPSTDIAGATRPAGNAIDAGAYESNGSVTPPSSTKFSINDRVQVTATVNTRSTPSTAGTLLGSHTAGDLGTVIGGPTAADGFNWWQINYDAGVDGWSVEDNLTKYTQAGTYTVTATAGSNGSVSPASQTVSSGSSATVTITPNSGYQISGITVDGVSVAIANPFILSNVTANKSVNVTFSPTNQPPTTGTTVNGITIPSGHPRLWYTPDRLALAKSRALPPIIPNSNTDNASACLAYLLKGDVTQGNSAVNFAMNFTIPSNELTGVSSDQARWNAEDAILVYDWCNDLFSANQKSTFVSRWNGYITTLLGKGWGGVGMEQSNYYWGYVRDAMEFAIATYGENSQAATIMNNAWVTRWQNSAVPFDAGLGRGGVAQEGSEYGPYVIDYPTIPLYSAGLLGRDVYNETNWYKEAAYYMIYATPGQTSGRGYEVFPFSDDGSWKNGSSATTHGYGNFMTAVSNYWPNSVLGQYARQWLNTVNPDVDRYAKTTDIVNSARSLSSLPTDYYAPGNKYLYSRSSWNSNAAVLNLQLGDPNGVGHQHEDEGSWQLWRNGKWISRESAGYGGSGIESAPYHNMVLYNGSATFTGERNGSPKITRIESNDIYSYAVDDLTDYYRNNLVASNHPERDNPTVKHLEREFLFVKPLDTLLVFDRVESTTAGATRSFVIHSESTITQESSNVWNSVNSSQAWRLTTLLPTNPTYSNTNESITDGQKRLTVSTSGQTLGYLLNVVQAKDAGGINVNASIVDNGTSYTVTLTHPTLGTAVITLNKGNTSTGGAIGFSTSGTPSSLRQLNTGVQSITANENGITWGPTSGGTTNPPPTTPDTQAPSIPSGLTATAQSSSAINLSWTTSTDNVGVSGYRIYRNGTQISTASTNTYSDTGLTANTTYTYTVVAYDAAGNTSSQSSSSSATTQAVTTPTGDTQAPTTPTGFTAVASNSTTMNLSWNVSSDNVGVDSYTILRNGAIIATKSVTAPNPTSFTDAVFANTTYTYTVYASDAAGNKSGNAISVTVTTPGTTTPPPTGSVAVDAATPSRVNLVHGSTGSSGVPFTGTTAGFTPPSGSLLLACVNADSQDGTNNESLTMSDSAGLAWRIAVERDPVEAAQGGYAAIAYAVVPTSAGMTVSASVAGHGNSDSGGTTIKGSMKVYVITGASSVGSTAEGNSSANNMTTSAYTSTAPGLGFVCGDEWNALGTPSSSDTTADPFNITNVISGLSGYKTVGGAGNAVNFNLDAAGTAGALWNWVSAEVK